MLIKNFYKDQEIFITGGTGFIGKAVIEKLLRSCPDLKKIYLLMRPKKGKNSRERLKELSACPLFDRLKKERPLALEKLHVIDGDCSEIGLGITAEGLAEIQNVNIIFHTAACVRFDDPLKAAVLLNTRGTHELVKLALNLKKLKVFLHTSTTYCNPDKKVVEEKIYPPYADWRATIKIAETCNSQLLNALDKKYGGNQPNTYTFTKSLAEQVINDYRDKLPVLVFRPSIVVSTIEDPVPGWIDNFNGPVGMLIACGIGIQRTTYANPDTIMDFVPVDVVARSMIVAAYKKVLDLENNQDNSGELEVYNCASSDKITRFTLREVIEIGRKTVLENPFEKTLWVPGGSATRCKYWNFIRFLTLHIFMAVLVDTGLRLIKQKPLLLKLQRKIFEASIALHYFMVNSWVFKNEKFYDLHNVIPKSEVFDFGINQFAENFDQEVFYIKAIRGARQYLLKEAPEASKSAKTRLEIYTIIHFLVQLSLVLLLVRYAFRYIYFNYL